MLPSSISGIIESPKPDHIKVKMCKLMGGGGKGYSSVLFYPKMHIGLNSMYMYTECEGYDEIMIMHRLARVSKPS